MQDNEYGEIIAFGQLFCLYSQMKKKKKLAIEETRSIEAKFSLDKDSETQ